MLSSKPMVLKCVHHKLFGLLLSHLQAQFQFFLHNICLDWTWSEWYLDKGKLPDALHIVKNWKSTNKEDIFHSSCHLHYIGVDNPSSCINQQSKIASLIGSQNACNCWSSSKYGYYFGNTCKVTHKNSNNKNILPGRHVNCKALIAPLISPEHDETSASKVDLSGTCSLPPLW